MKLSSDRVFGVFGLLLAGLIFWRALVIQESFIQDPLGPKAFPAVIALVIALTSLFMIVKPDEEPHWPSLAKIAEIAAAAGVMVVYSLFLSDLGFIISTTLAAAYLSWRLGSSAVASLVVGVCISIGIYVIFHFILGLHLATGPLGF